MQIPKITVAQVTYNSSSTIEESILSIINQTYSNIEYVVVDGASTDSTLQILNKYRDRISALVSEPDEGIYDAMNKALSIATGDFLIFMGSDDHFLSWRTLEKVVPKLIDQDHTFYGQIYFEEYNLLHKGKFNKFKRARLNYCHQAIFYPKSVYKQYKYDCRYKLYADNEYNYRISIKYPFKWIDETVSFYAAGGESTKKNDIEWDKVKDFYIVKYCGILPLFGCKIWLFLNRMKKLLIG